MSSSRTRVPAASGPTQFAHPTPGWSYPGTAPGPAEARHDAASPPAAPVTQPAALELGPDGVPYIRKPDGSRNGLVETTTGPGGGVVNPAVVVRGEQWQPYNHNILSQNCDARKKGLIGVGNRGVIAIRFDDWQDALKTSVAPEMQSRGLPYSVALISRWRTAQPWGAGTTAADIKSLVDNGAELWSHGLDHKDYIGYEGLRANIVDSKAEIEAAINARVMGFSLPGVAPVYTAGQRGQALPYDGLTDPADWYGPTGRLIMDTYEQAEAYSSGSYCPVGAASPRYGRAHVTISDGVTLTTALGWLDKIKREQLSLRVMCHAGNLGNPGCMTIEEFKTWLNAVVTAWDAGLIEVVSPSSLAYVTRDAYRYDLLYGQGSFAGLSQASPGIWNNLGGANNTVFQTGGYDDGPYIEIPTAGGVGPNARPTLAFPVGESYLFEGWAKSKGASTTNPRVIIRTYPDAGALSIDKSFPGTGNATWTRIRVPFTIPPKNADGSNVTTVLIQPHRNSGDPCGWSNITVRKL